MHVARLLLPALAFCAAAGPASPQNAVRAAAGLAATLQQSGLPAPPADAKYLGAGSCAASACHGGIQPRDTTKVLQNEYSIWIAQDRHSHIACCCNRWRSAWQRFSTSARRKR